MDRIYNYQTARIKRIRDTKDEEIILGESWDGYYHLVSYKDGQSIGTHRWGLSEEKALIVIVSFILNHE